MSPYLIIVTGAIYAFISLEQFFKGNPYVGMMYAGYAFSNIGLYFMAK
jgi:hypothetical protein